MTAPAAWPMLVLAALDAVVAGAITFSPNHSLATGAIVVASWAAATSIIRLVTMITQRGRQALAQGAFALVTAGVVVAAVIQVMQGSSALAFATTLAIAAGLQALIAVVATWSLPRTQMYRRDALLYAGISLVFAIIVMVLPRESIHLVGSFGLYLAVTAVFRAIAGFSYLSLSRQARMDSRERA